MSTFKRNLHMGFLSEGISTLPWFASLLKNWQPAGAPTVFTSDGVIGSLRLGIRNGYVNFYCGGQSVALVRFGKRELSAKIHVKYLACNQAKESKASLGQSHVTISKPDSMLPEYGSVEEWMANTRGYQGKEKKFVERVVATNSNIIDLEMALPSFLGKDDKKVAPRMDIVALEPNDTGWRIVFWEAKLVTSPEARAAGNIDPKVIVQCKNYHHWLNTGLNKEAVIKAYRETCRLLANFHEDAEKAGIAMAPLGEGIRAVAAKRDVSLSVDDRVRLLVDNITAPNEVFRKNKHLDKLLNREVSVQMVDREDDLQLKQGRNTG